MPDIDVSPEQSQNKLLPFPDDKFCVGKLEYVLQLNSGHGTVQKIQNINVVRRKKRSILRSQYYRISVLTIYQFQCLCGLPANFKYFVFILFTFWCLRAEYFIGCDLGQYCTVSRRNHCSNRSSVQIGS